MAIMGKSRKTGVDAPSSPPESGWPALHKTVRDADVTKVDDCREDIDTLLVFAGLYSAVLTAFVVESYTHLQQDPQDVIIGLLEQIATQRFITGPGFINSTITSTPPPPFEPPLWAVRVNILWFASLLLSLASASFGILVKQWLREYLAIEHSSPRERLRARQYRNPALAQWKVFEIAAFLPLLLQLSLGLFFLGLCFFTAAVHSSIGRTTTPLVCAWAFLFFVTTIAPLFSPRCPFKTTFLKSTLRAGRCYITPLLTRLLRLIGQLILRFAVGWKNLVGIVIDGTISGHHQVVNTLYDVGDSIPWEWAQILFVVMCCILFSPVIIPILTWNICQSMQPVGSRLQKPFNIWKQIACKAVSQEEDQVIKTEEEDVQVLLSVDSIVSDDALLQSMVDALRQQAGATSENTFKFILQVIGNRIPSSLDVPRLTFVPDLRPLSKLAWSTVTNAIADLLQNGPILLDHDSPDWVFNSVIILLSPSPFELSKTATQALHWVSTGASEPSECRCSDAVHPMQCLARVRASEPDTPPNVSSAGAGLRRTMELYKTLLCKEAHHYHSSLRHLLDEHMSEDGFVASSEKLFLDIFEAILPFLLRAISSQKDLAEIPGSHEAVHIILQYGEKFGRRDDAVKLCRQMLLTESGTRMLLVQFAALHPQCRVSELEDIREILRGVGPSTSLEDHNRIRSHLTAACEWFCNGGNDSDDDVPLDYVRLCTAFIRWIWNDDQTARAVAKAIEKYCRTRGWRKELQRRDHWYSDAPSPTSEELFKEDQGLACKVLKDWWIDSTELKDALWRFVPADCREEVLHSIQANHPEYTPPARPAPSTALEESENGQGGTAKGRQEAGDAGQEGPESMGQDADAEDAEASGGAYLDAVAVPGGDEGTADQDATGGEAVGEGAVEDGGDLTGGGDAQGMLTMAGN